MDRVGAIVVGAGVVGLAAAKALAESGREVLVLEREAAIGMGVSSRNSEVIHAGIYYPPGSLKARACLRGKRLLEAYCAERGVPTRRVGKLIVATQDMQIVELERIAANAAACGMTELRLVDAGEARRIEPEVAAVAALHSPGTGIVDSHALMLALQGDLESAGGTVATRAPVLGVQAEAPGFVVEIGGEAELTLGCDVLVNAASLDAPGLAGRIAGYPQERVPRAFLAKGNYMSLVGVRAPFRGLVYPVPEPGGLGIHATVDMGGQVRFGPDVQWVDEIDYTPDAGRIDRFRDAIRAYWPGLPEGALTASYAGIRPKIVGPGEPNADFVVEGPEAHGVPGLVNLFGIESPGLTSCLALAEEVLARLET